MGHWLFNPRDPKYDSPGDGVVNVTVKEWKRGTQLSKRQLMFARFLDDDWRRDGNSPVECATLYRCTQRDALRMVASGTPLIY